MTMPNANTPVMFEQRCNQGHLHVCVIALAHAQHLVIRVPNCVIYPIDRQLIAQAEKLVP